MANNYKRNVKDVAIFFIFGWMVFFQQLTVISAAQDILRGTFVPTPVVIIAATGLGSLITIVGPFFFQKVSYHVWIVVIVTLFIGGNVVMVIPSHVSVKIVGVCLISGGLGLSDLVFPSMTAFYYHQTVAAFATGTGFGHLLASIYNFGLSVMAGVPPQIVLYTVAPLPLTILVGYFFLSKPFIQDHVTESTNRKAKYLPLSQSLQEDEEHHSLSTTEKLRAIWDVWPLLASLFTTVFCQYITMEALVTTLAFPNTSFRPRDQYVAYVMCMAVGISVGSSSYFCLSFCVNTSICSLRVTMTLAFLEAVLTVWFCIAAWYRFVSSMIIIYTAVFLTGFFNGSVYSNVLRLVGEGNRDRVKEFSRALTSCVVPLPVLIAGLLGLFTETVLRQHCFEIVNDVKYCFTRNVQQ